MEGQVSVDQGMKAEHTRQVAFVPQHGPGAGKLQGVTGVKIDEEDANEWVDFHISWSQPSESRSQCWFRAKAEYGSNNWRCVIRQMACVDLFSMPTSHNRLTVSNLSCDIKVSTDDLHDDVYY